MFWKIFKSEDLKIIFKVKNPDLMYSKMNWIFSILENFANVATQAWTGPVKRIIASGYAADTALNEIISIVPHAPYVTTSNKLQKIITEERHEWEKRCRYKTLMSKKL